MCGAIMDEENKSFAVVLEPEDVESIQQLADVVVESLQEGFKSDLESFEVYAQKMRSHIHADAQVFRARFLKGYHILLEELHKRQDRGENSQP